MANIRDIAQPSGVDVEVFVNERLAQVVNTFKPVASGFMAQDYDMKCNRLDEYPGPGWEFVSTVPLGPALVGCVWRISRAKLVDMGREPVMKMTKPQIPGAQ